MRCDTCGEELAPDLQECPRCAGGAATAPADPNIQLVPVFTAGDPALTALARSLLDGEGIEYAVRNDSVQDLIGWGRVGANFNLATGPAEFIVREDDAARATELLRDLTTELPDTLSSREGDADS